MLINLSNHPFDEWEEQHQKAAIALFGKIEDLPYPDIDPTWDTSSVVLLSAKYITLCLSKFSHPLSKKDAVHISGEPCFLFHFVTMAREQGVPCVCSTTRRLVTNKRNIKTSVFNFVQFRNY